MSLQILLIEDEQEIADFLIKGLSEEGWKVQHASDGAQGAHLLHTKNWDVVLLDWWLPSLDGLAILQGYRKAGGETPILFLTAKDTISDRIVGLDSGADDYLCKPFSFEELLARVRVLVRRPRYKWDPVIRYLNVSLDTISLRCERAGQKLDLTTKERILLRFFLQNPGRVLSREEIYEEVWDDAYDGLTNTLEVHVMELRRKLEGLGPRLIHTIRHRGYLFGETDSSLKESNE